MRAGLFFFLIIVSIPIQSDLAEPVALVDSVSQPTALEESPRYFVLETLTVYNPLASQCDDSPLITASNKRIDLEKLRLSEIRWMALSRNLLKKWDGEFNYGDTVVVKAGDPEIDGLWVINDNMNKRFKDRGDLLFHHDARRTGMWKNVRISRWDSRTDESI